MTAVEASAARAVLVRHGESVANVEGRIANRPPGPPLTPEGERQAAALARRLAELDVGEVRSSPLLRAVQTASALSALAGVPVRVADGLREFDMGDAEGRTDAAAWDAHAAVLRAWSSGDTAARAPGGESLDDVIDRFAPVLHDAVSTHGTTVLVSHGGLLGAALPLLVREGVALPRWDHVDVLALGVDDLRPL